MPSDEHLNRGLDDFVAHDRRVSDLLAGATPVGRRLLKAAGWDDLPPAYLPGMLMVGDAASRAGHVGILESIYAGRQAAVMAAGAIEGGDVSGDSLAGYDRLVRQPILERLEAHHNLTVRIARLDDQAVDLASLETVGPPVGDDLTGEPASWGIGMAPLAAALPAGSCSWHC